MRTKRVLILLAPFIFGALTLSWSQTSTPDSTDLVLGRWHLNLEESSYSPGPPPRSQVRVYAVDLDGLATRIVTVDASGQESTIHYVADYDSLEYTVSGSSRVDTIVLKRVDAHTASATLRHGSKTLGNALRKISKDGKKMTITFDGTTADGRKMRNVAVYDKKSSP